MADQVDRPPRPDRMLQPSFGAGELAPSLQRRSDLAQWRIGLADSKNVIITAQGGAARRAGTEFVAIARTGDGFQNRVIPFQFSTEDQYIVEIGPLYARFINNGRLVMSGGAPYVITTPYAGVDIHALKFVQSADVVTITHPYYQPMDLKRYGLADWRLVPVAIGTRLSAPANLVATARNDATVTGSPAPTARPFTYAVTVSSASTADESGLSNQSICSNLDLGYYTQFGYRNDLAWDAVAGASYYTVYRFYQGSWAQIARTVNNSFTDTNFVPNTAEAPPTATNPFGPGLWPATVGYYQQRKVYGGSYNEPETLRLSRSGNFNNFDVSDPVRDDDAITYTLAAQQVNQIRHIIALNDLIVMTSGGGWKVSSGGNGGPISPNSIEALPQSFVGASDVAPLVIGSQVIYIEEKGSTVRNIAFQFVQNQYVSNDLSEFAPHLLAGHQIVAWAYAEVPDKIVWIVRDDGALLSMTYVVNESAKVLAWTKHETNGIVRSVAVISENIDGSGRIDVPYFVVQRPDPFGAYTQTIERMQTRRLGLGNIDNREAWHVDGGTRYDGPATTVIGGLTQFADTALVAYLADGVPGFAYVSGGAITLPVPASLVIVGRGFTSSITLMPADSSHPGDDTWAGRRKHLYRARVAVENAAGIMASVDGNAFEPLVDPDTFLEPGGMVTSVLEVRPSEGWSRDGKLTLYCNATLPATIAAVAMEWGVED